MASEALELLPDATPDWRSNASSPRKRGSSEPVSIRVLRATMTLARRGMASGRARR